MIPPGDLMFFSASHESSHLKWGFSFPDATHPVTVRAIPQVPTVGGVPGLSLAGSPTPQTALTCTRFLHRHVGGQNMNMRTKKLGCQRAHKMVAFSAQKAKNSGSLLGSLGQGQPPQGSGRNEL